MKYFNLLFILLLSIYSNSKKLQQNENYFIRFTNNNCLDVQGMEINANYISFPCHQGINQSWRLRYNSNDGTYTFLSNINNQSMDVEMAWTHDGAQIRNWHNNEGDAQRFYIERTNDCRLYRIVMKHSGKCVTAENLTEVWANVKQNTCNQNSLVYFQSPFNTDAFPVGARGSCTPNLVPAPATASATATIPAPATATAIIPAPTTASVPASIQSIFCFIPRQTVQTFQLNFFDGTWIVDGMICNNQYADLQVKFNGFVAIVSQGNSCYNPGSILFFGNFPTKFDNKENNIVNYYADNKTTVRVWLSITGNNSFVISKYNLVFFRKL